MQFARRLGACALLLAVCAGTSHGQTLPATTDDALHALMQMAAVVFTGQVTAVRPGAGVVEIDFAVQDAIFGVSGGTYALREWAGAWTAAGEPFRVGQSYLMLLHAPGPGGLSSPVGGMDGAIPLRGESAAVGPAVTQAPPTAGGATVAPASGATVDLSWVATWVVRGAPWPVAPTASPVTVHAQAVGATLAAAQPAARLLGNPRQELRATVTRLRQWAKEDRRAR